MSCIRFYVQRHHAMLILVFPVSLTSLGAVASGPIGVAANSTLAQPGGVAPQSTRARTRPVRPQGLSVRRRLGGLRVAAVVTGAAVNIGVHGSFRIIRLK